MILKSEDDYNNMYERKRETVHYNPMCLMSWSQINNLFRSPRLTYGQNDDAPAFVVFIN